ncbi:MAG: aspartate kinase [Ignavibacteria bacterium]
MNLIVQKYGGSSVADADKIMKIAEIIAAVKKEAYNVVVVVSAMGKTTNQLIEMANKISKNPPRREMEMLLSTGERVSMAVLCIALNELGIDAISLTGSQSGIITNDRHNDARVIEVRPFRVQDELEKGKVVVIGGFQGVSYKRDITTLGRGGSDTSAVALAAALNAERCEIYSDIDGVYTSDPAMIKEAKHLPVVSYQQMQEMSQAGAKVLNAQAVQFAKDAQIAIYARSTFQPGRETVVRQLSPEIPRGVKAVVYEKDIVRVVLHSKHIIENFNLLANFFEDKQIPIKELNLSESSNEKSKVSFIVSLSNVYAWESVKEELIKIFGKEIEFNQQLGTVSLIGEGLNRDNTILLDTINLLNKEKIEIKGIATTSFRISLLIKREFVESCVKICHKKWIEESMELPE